MRGSLTATSGGRMIEVTEGGSPRVHVGGSVRARGYGIRASQHDKKQPFRAERFIRSY